MSTIRDRHGQQARHVGLGSYLRASSRTPDIAPPAELVSFVQSVVYGVAAAGAATLLTLCVGLLWR